MGVAQRDRFGRLLDLDRRVSLGCQGVGSRETVERRLADCRWRGDYVLVFKARFRFDVEVIEGASPRVVCGSGFPHLPFSSPFASCDED